MSSRTYILLLFVFIWMNSFCQSPLELESIDKCSSISWISGYRPEPFLDSNRVNQEILISIRKKFKENFGKQLSNKIKFAIGFEYDLDSLSDFHTEQIKDYRWEIPQYILNYAFTDVESGIIYCLHFDISKDNEILKGYIPKIKKEYWHTRFISEEEAIGYIHSSKIKNKRKKLKKVTIGNGRLVYNDWKEIFEWQFGGYYQVLVEAIPNGEVSFGRSEGIYDF